MIKRVSRKAIRNVQTGRAEALRRKLSQRKYISPQSTRKPDAHIIPKEDWFAGDDIYAKLLSR
ncbi:hypothetical protein EDC32_10861 [Laceyella sacchari]|jgi:hypothetical protein|uniref:hypothetical protein n=1 Tax=Laceyella sacchari TaxID=37482 RepID=UPI0010E5C6E4|nr:hypothetical protein [Laceyella sacchari]TCW35349.1 hypothetical protein EDC32_10861 [Laceyella sacchari]